MGIAQTMIVLICPRCHRRLQASEALANSLVKCPECQTSFTVPSQSASPAPSLNYLEGDEAEQSRPQPRHILIEERDKTDAPGVISLIFGCLAILCALFGFLTFGVAFYVAVPFALIGGLVGFYGKGNMRVAGLVLNFLALIPAVAATVILIVGVIALKEQEARHLEDQRQREAEQRAEARKNEAEAERLRQQAALEKERARLLEESHRREREKEELRLLLEQRRQEAEARRKAEQEAKEEAAREAARQAEEVRKVKEEAARELARKAELEKKGLPYYSLPLTLYEERNAQEWHQLLRDRPNDRRVWEQATKALVALKGEGMPFLLNHLTRQTTRKDRNIALELIQVEYVHPNDLHKLLPCLDQGKAFNGTRMLALSCLERRAKDLSKNLVPEIERLIEDMLTNSGFKEETRQDIRSKLATIRMGSK